MSDEILTIEGAADLLKMTVPQMREICRARSRERQGRPIPRIKLGKVLRFRRSSLMEWLEQLEDKQTVQ